MLLTAHADTFIVFTTFFSSKAARATAADDLSSRTALANSTKRMLARRVRAGEDVARASRFHTLSRIARDGSTFSCFCVRAARGPWENAFNNRSCRSNR